MSNFNNSNNRLKRNHSDDEDENCLEKDILNMTNPIEQEFARIVYSYDGVASEELKKEIFEEKFGLDYNSSPINKKHLQ